MRRTGKISAQELGFVEESLENLMGDLGFIRDSSITSVDLDELYEQLDELYWDISDTRKMMEAAQYLATAGFVKRGMSVKLDNAKKVEKAKAILKKVGMYFNDDEIRRVLDFYNQYFKDAYNAYAQFDEDDAYGSDRDDVRLSHS